MHTIAIYNAYDAYTQYYIKGNWSDLAWYIHVCESLIKSVA